MRTQEQELNQEAYWRMKDTIKATYPQDQFVAIAGGEIVGDATDFMTLYRALKASGRNPQQTLIVQAGHDYLRKATIFHKVIQ